MTNLPETLPPVGDAYSFHGARLADVAEHPPVIFDADSPDGRAVRPPEDGSLAVAKCDRCFAYFYRFPAARVRVCRGCADAVHDAAIRRNAAPLLSAIAADGLGLRAEIAHTGGGCTGIAVDLGGGECGTYTGSRFYALLTHAEDASAPEVGDPIAVGIYDGREDDGCGYPEDDGPLFLLTDSPEAAADFCFRWADRLIALDRADADTLQRWGIDSGRRFGFGAV